MTYFSMSRTIDRLAGGLANQGGTTVTADEPLALDVGMRMWLDHLRVEKGVARNTMLSYGCLLYTSRCV